MILELLGVAGFATLMSAWAVYIYPKCRKDKPVTDRMMIFTQGQCAQGLLMTDRDKQRIQESEAKEAHSELENGNHSLSKSKEKLE